MPRSVEVYPHCRTRHRFLSMMGVLGNFAVFGLIIVILSSFDDPITDPHVSAAEDAPTTPEQAEISKNQQKLHCLGDYTYCTNEEVFLSAYDHWAKTDCKFEVKYEAEEFTRYGRPWFSSLTSFPILIDVSPKTGEIALYDDTIKIQTASGNYRKTPLLCTWSAKEQRVISLIHAPD